MLLDMAPYPIQDETSPVILTKPIPARSQRPRQATTSNGISTPFSTSQPAILTSILIWPLVATEAKQRRSRLPDQRDPLGPEVRRSSSPRTISPRCSRFEHLRGPKCPSSKKVQCPRGACGCPGKIQLGHERSEGSIGKVREGLKRSSQILSCSC